jgi:hypothetical protein
MAWTQTDLDALDAAIASGALTVRYGDTSTTHRSLEEMRQVRTMIQQALATATGTRRRRLIKVCARRGY